MNDYQDKAMRTLCDQHQARIHMSGAAGPGNEWLDRQPMIYEGPPCPSFISDLRTKVTVNTSPGAYNNLIPVQATHAIVGLTGEVGELASVLQKWLWYGKAFTLVELQQKVKDEAGDVLWYVAELLSAFGLSMQDVMEANIAKLKVRYPEKYADALAADEARDRAAEACAIMQPCPVENPCVAIAKDYGTYRTVNDVMKAKDTPEGCCTRNMEDMPCDCLAEAATADRQARCPHNGDWAIIQTEVGSGRRCGLCGKTEAY